MKKTMSKVAQRKLEVRSEAIQILSPARLTVVAGGFLQDPTQIPHSVFQGCTQTQPPFI
jgi:hypothetical protein